MDQVARITAIIEPTISAMGYDLVWVGVQGSTRRVLQVMAERADGLDMTVEDCADISHSVAAVLDVEDPISGRYVLEVSSPGIDRPLTRLKDFDRYSGFEAKVELGVLFDGRRRYRGLLAGIDEQENVLIDVDGERYAVPFNSIAKAKLILTDALIAATTTARQGDIGRL